MVSVLAGNERFRFAASRPRVFFVVQGYCGQPRSEAVAGRVMQQNVLAGGFQGEIKERSRARAKATGRVVGPSWSGFGTPPAWSWYRTNSTKYSRVHSRRVYSST